MKRLKWWYGVSLLAVIILALVGGIALVQNVAALSTGVPQPHQSPNLSTDVMRSYVPGGPAIPVHVSAGTNTSYTNTSLTPAFTKDDVTAFLNKKGFYAGPLVQGAHLKILTIQFVTAKQASTLMVGESVGRPDNYLVCYVKVQGPFQLTNVHAGPHIPGMKTKTTAETGDMVFDGHTGNVLVWGVY